MSALGSLFSAPQINYTPPSFNTGGISGSYSGGAYNFTNSPTLNANIGNLQSTFGQQAGALGKLASTVQPGFSQFRQAGLADISNTQASTVSNLRDNLAQRRVLGSSFGNAQISNSQADFAAKQADFEAQSYLAELDASNKLTQEQFTAQASQYSTAINQSNIEAGIAADLTGKASTALASVATAQAKLDADNAAGIGKAIGSVAGLGIGGGNTIGGSLFSSAAGGMGELANSLNFSEGVGSLSGLSAADIMAIGA